MRGLGSHHAEVARGFDEASPEDFLPHAVYDDSPKKGLVGRKQPVSEGAPVLRCSGGGGGKEVRGGRADPLDPGVIIAPLQQVGIARGRPFLRDQAGLSVLGEGRKGLGVR